MQQETAWGAYAAPPPTRQLATVFRTPRRTRPSDTLHPSPRKRSSAFGILLGTWRRSLKSEETSNVVYGSRDVQGRINCMKHTYMRACALSWPATEYRGSDCPHREDHRFDSCCVIRLTAIIDSSQAPHHSLISSLLFYFQPSSTEFHENRCITEIVIKTHFFPKPQFY